MKKLLLALLLLPTLCSAQFLGTRDDYIAQTRLKLGLNGSASGMLTDTTASSFLTEAIVQIVPSDGYIRKVTTITSVREQASYDLDTTLVKIDRIFWKKNDTTKSIVYAPTEAWDKMAHKTTRGTTDPYLRRPSYYDKTPDSVYLFPPPTISGDTYYVIGWHRLADAASATDLTLIPEQYRTPILNYMVWGVAASRNMPQADKLFEILQWSLAKIGVKTLESSGQSGN